MHVILAESGGLMVTGIVTSWKVLMYVDTLLGHYVIRLHNLLHARVRKETKKYGQKENALQTLSNTQKNERTQGNGTSPKDKTKKQKDFAF